MKGIRGIRLHSQIRITPMNFKKVLLQTNLTPSQAEILEFLYQNKEAKASEIAKKIGRSRAIVYKEIEELANISLIERKDKPGQASVFLAGHPSLLQKLIEKRELELKKDRELLNNYLPDIISSYNLINQKPGIRHYEGNEGALLAMEDSLTSRTEILTIVDVEVVNKFLKEENKTYVKKRNKLGIKKRLLVLDSPYARQHFAERSDFTDIKFINLEIAPFNTSIQIYGNKISYITMAENNLTATIINDPHIYSMHKALFEFIWSKI